MIITNSRVPKLFSLVINVYAITLWPFIFIRDEGNLRIINHESIHLKQQKELLIVLFYILYGMFWLYHFIKLRNKVAAYYAIPFEKEAYENDNNLDYLKNRKFYSWVNYL